MNGAEKILNRIKTDCDESIKIIEAEAQADCDNILKDAEAQAKQIEKEINESSKAKSAQIAQSSKSRAELEYRNELLKKRREEIDLTVNAVLDYLLNLSDEEYFEALIKLAKKLNKTNGDLFLNEKDLARVPADFENKLSAAGVNANISKTPANICGGFILKCGDIEENMDFEAIINSERGALEDLINRELFTE